MKVTIPKHHLLDTVNKVKSIVSTKSALPILSHILFETGDGLLRLSATDLKVSIECTVDCTVETPGSLTVSCQRLASVLSELPDADITLELCDSNIILLECGKIQTKLFSMAADEFPPIRSFEGIEPLILQQKVLRNVFIRTSFAICSDPARYNLTGLLIEISNGCLTAVATDGRRMSLFKETEGIADGIDVRVIVPGKMIHELERLLDPEEGDIKVYIDENQAAFVFASVRMVSALIEGTFPNYDMVVPKEHDKEALANTNLFIEAMRRTRTMTNDKFNSVRFLIGGGLIKLKVVTPEVGEYEEEIAVNYDGEEVEIAFNPDFVLDALRHVDTEQTSLLFKNSKSPGVLKPSTESKSNQYVNVVMPIRI